MRVGLPHLGQSVLLEVSITFLRSAVLAILAIMTPVLQNSTPNCSCGICRGEAGTQKRVFEDADENRSTLSACLILQEPQRNCLTSTLSLAKPHSNGNFEVAVK